MTGNALKDIEQVESSLWEAADQLRANSTLTSSEYVMPVLGIIFLRHAANRYTAARAAIEADQAAGKMPKRPLIQADFKKRRAMLLPPEARFDALLRLPNDTNLGAALVGAMHAIEAEFAPLVGQLPKDYESFDPGLLENLLRIFDKEGKPLWGNCDFVMANPPFNVDMVDASRAAGDCRLPFGLPGTTKNKQTKKETVSNGNYLWISYFWSYLNARGRAGFVMSSQASSGGHGEATVRRKLVETGDVDVMIAIRANFVKQIDLLYKLAARAAQLAQDLARDESVGANSFARDVKALPRRLKQLDAERKTAVEQLKLAVYFHRQILWLQERFPEAEFIAVPGLCKTVTRAEIAAADWSLTPGRYVGVAPTEEDEDFDFERTLRDIHVELADLNREAAELAARIQENFEKIP